MDDLKRLINADPVYEDLRKSYEELKSIRDTLTQHEDIQICNGQLVVFQEALMCIKNAPSVDAVEVVHGKWVWKPYNERVSRLICSVCKREDGACEEYTYCPNCGAKMDGGNEDG